MAEAGEGSTTALRAGLVVAGITGLGAFGPALGLSAAWIVVAVGGGLVLLSVDAASWQGMGGHVVAEALPGGEGRLRRIAVHEAGHLLIAEQEQLPVERVGGRKPPARAAPGDRDAGARGARAHASPVTGGGRGTGLG